MERKEEEMARKRERETPPISLSLIAVGSKKKNTTVTNVCYWYCTINVAEEMEKSCETRQSSPATTSAHGDSMDGLSTNDLEENSRTGKLDSLIYASIFISPLHVYLSTVSYAIQRIFISPLQCLNLSFSIYIGLSATASQLSTQI